MTTEQTIGQETQNEPEPSTPRDLLADMDAVLGIEPATVRYLAVRLARHAPKSYEGLTAEALVDKLIELGIPQTRNLGVWVIEPAEVREALMRREATSIRPGCTLRTPATVSRWLR